MAPEANLKLGQNSKFKIFNLVIFVSYFSIFPIVQSLPKSFHIYAQKLKDGTFLDLLPYDYSQTIKLVEDCHVPIYL